MFGEGKKMIMFGYKDVNPNGFWEVQRERERERDNVIRG